MAMRRRFGLWPALVLAGALSLGACEKHEEKAQKEPETMPRPNTMLLNPASLHCKKIMGTTLLAKLGNGAVYGICRLRSGRECEEWALFLGFCPTSGIDPKAYTDPAARYCVLRAGHVAGADSPEAASNAGPDAICQLPDHVDCKLGDLYAGKCESPLK